MASLTIDGRIVDATPGTTLWEAAQKLGIEIPTLCHLPRMGPVGVCRLCVVDVGGRVLAASCVRQCEPGMNVVTHSEKIDAHRRMLVALLLSDHPTPCARERTTRDCELEALGRRYGLLEETAPADASTSSQSVNTSVRSDRRLEIFQELQSRDAAVSPTPDDVMAQREHRPSHRPRQRDLSSTVIAVDHAACILCDRCIRACDDIQSNEVIGRTGKGYHTSIGFDLNQPMGKSTCVSCGECAASCPTGALVHKAITLPLAPRSATRAVDSVCPYCGVGCTLTYHVQQDQIIYAEGRDSPGSGGRLCVKGRYGWDYAAHPHRLTRPLIRRPEFYPKGPLSADVRGDPPRPGAVYGAEYHRLAMAFREADWEEALDMVAGRLMAIKRQHGPASLAGFGSAKCSNEEAYLFQKLVRAVFGSNNVDHCTRLCHASSVAALIEGIGSGAVTDVFSHAELAEVVLLTGTNTTVNHPVAATYFKHAAKQGTKFIVVDPRRPDIADFATYYCRIRPDSDVAFYNGLMHVLIAEDLIDHDFISRRTENFEALKSNVASYPPERVAPLCGIDADTIRTLARTIGRAKTMMIFWGMGISQHTHGTDNARCLIALCLLTGNIGRPGTGLHPLRGQNNVQGASDAGLIPMVYPDYQRVDDDAVRAKFERAWGVALDPKPGLTVVEIIGGALEGRIKGLYMMGENPFLSDPNVNKVRKALAKLEFLGVQDVFLTETCEFADVILPTASCLEKLGTYTNTDRRVQIGRPALDPPGMARLDWQIVCEIARRMGYPMNYRTVEEVFAEMASLTTSYRGLTYETLGKDGKLWPIAALGEPETPVLFSDRFPTKSGKGRFVPCQPRPAKELPDSEYPLVLNTGRLLEHWHTGTMTRRTHVLSALAAEAVVEIHPDDLCRLGIGDGERVRVSSRRGSITLKAVAGTKTSPGSVFIPFHFREAAANLLTIDELDPYGKIPEFKFCAVKVERAD